MGSFKINTLCVSSQGRIPTLILKVNLNILVNFIRYRIVLQSTASQQTHWKSEGICGVNRMMISFQVKVSPLAKKFSFAEGWRINC